MTTTEIMSRPFCKKQRINDIIACMPSGDDSDFVDLTDDDEYIPSNAPRLVTTDTDISDQSSEQDDEDMSSSRCGTGCEDRGHRRKHLMDEVEAPTFTDPSTQPAEVRSFLSYFRQFVTPSMMREVVRETKLHSIQMTGQFLNITESELEQFVCLYLFMGLVQMPCVRSYWEHETRFPPIAEITPRNRSEKIMCLLHFTDKNKANAEAKKG
ncbi:hypothetical protein MRX96_022203 [Rhipicephalus microplus]